jgi:hypothetical protein
MPYIIAVIGDFRLLYLIMITIDVMRRCTTAISGQRRNPVQSLPYALTKEVRKLKKVAAI